MALKMYSMAMCFVCGLIFLITIPLIVMGGFQVISPSNTLASYTYDRLTNDDSYWKTTYEYKEDKVNRPPLKVLSEERNIELEKELKLERRSGWSIIRNCLLFLLNALLFYCVHFRIYKRVSDA